MTDTQSTATRSAAIWALLIGIDEYQAVSPLRGCVNDVEALRLLLMHQLNVPAEHITVLTNQYATRARILRTFEDFLIDNPDIQPGDQVLFHYSGHGSRMPDVTGGKPDGSSETLVAYDSRMPGVYDIPDTTLQALLDRLTARKGQHITLILDCCHASSGTPRVVGPDVARVRRVPPADRRPPSDLDANLRIGPVLLRDTGPSGWLAPTNSYVLLAACSDGQEAYEYCTSWGDDAPSQVWYGALTYFTLQALRSMVPDTTYAELHEQVLAQVHANYPSQTPQCEGARERLVFGEIRVQREPLIPVQGVTGDIVTLQAGLVHGLRPGTELALYPPDVRTRAELPLSPLATVEVIEVAATTARARLQDGSSQPIPLHARSLVTKYVYASLRQTVALHAAAGAENQQAIERLRQTLQQAMPDGSPSPYLQVIDDSDQVAALRVEAASGQLSIYNANGELLVAPEDIQEQDRSKAVAVCHALENIVRYRALLALTNQEPGARLTGKVKLRLRRYIKGAQATLLEDLPPEAIDAGGELTLYVDPEHVERNLYVVDLINTSSLAVYPSIFILNPDYSIFLLHPRSGESEAIGPGETLTVGLLNHDERVQFWLPAGWEASRDYFKVVLTTTPSDLRMLEQYGLNVPPPKAPLPVGERHSTNPLAELLGVSRSTAVRVGRPMAPLSSDWGTAELEVRVQLFLPDGITKLREQALRLYQQGQDEPALVRARQACHLARKHLGDTHLTLATALDNLGVLYTLAGNCVAAEPLLQEALAIRRTAFEAAHPDLATSLNNLAELYYVQGNYGPAEPLGEQAVEVMRATLGDNHPACASVLANLAKLYATTGRTRQALLDMERVAAIHDEVLELLSALESEPQRMAYLALLQEHASLFLSLVLQYFPTSRRVVQTGLDLVLRWKAIATEVLAVPREAVLERRYPDLAPKLRALMALRRRVAEETLAGPGPDGVAAYQQRRKAWHVEAGWLKADLARQIPARYLERQLWPIDHRAVARALPEGAVLVEFVCFPLYDFQAVPARGEPRWKPRHYVAFVLPARRSPKVRMIDLGEAEPIDQRVAAFHTAIAREADDGTTRSTEALRQTGAAMRAAVFEPLEATLDGRRHLILAPDGELIRLPFAALPMDDGNYLIDNYHVSYLQTGRDALRVGAKSTSQTTEPLVIANPDFDLQASSSLSRDGAERRRRRWSRDLDRSHLVFTPLPGTRAEGETIAAILSVKPWLGDRALEVSLKAFQSPPIVHFATNGFFLPDQPRTPHSTPFGLAPIGEVAGSRWSRLSGLGLENPLLRAGLALAGANTSLRGGELPAKAQAEDGLLMAEEIAGLDLLDTELVVLSACSMEFSQGRHSESIASLQRAFCMAGAANLVMPLGLIPDQPTTALMKDFYSRVLDGHPHSQALREAQRALKAHQYPSPFYWGAFICLGDLSPVLVQRTGFVEAVSPYVVGRPALGKSFVGRQDVLKTIHDNLGHAAGKNILLLRGQRRTGKTSVLYRLCETLYAETQGAYLPVLVDVQGMMASRDESEFFWRLTHEITRDLKQYTVHLPELRLSDFREAPTSVFEFAFLEPVTDVLGDRRIFLMLDEFDTLKKLIDHKRVGAEVLDFFRHLMQHTPLLFLIAGTHELRGFTGGYWTVFFNLVKPIDIGALEVRDARWLVTEPVKEYYSITSPAVNEIVHVTGYHPYFTQLVCDELVKVRNRYRLSVVTESHVNEAVEGALQSGGANVGYPWTEVDCSADERLVLALLAREGSQGTPVTVSMVWRRLHAAGVTVALEPTLKRLQERGVVPQDKKDRLTFVVPLFQKWLVQMHYDTLVAARQYNADHPTPTTDGGVGDA